MVEQGVVQAFDDEGRPEEARSRHQQHHHIGLKTKKSHAEVRGVSKQKDDGKDSCCKP